jgi:hypothetical protein
MQTFHKINWTTTGVHKRTLPVYFLFRVVDYSLSSWDNLILDNAVVKKQSGRGGGTTEHATPALFCPFQKQYRKNRKTVQFLLSNGTKWSVKSF